MGTYNKPKKKLHREFVYLNHDVVLNSLSAFEAGQIDEIIEKTSEATEGAIEGGINIKAIRAGGAKKKQGAIQEELVRTRTWFSAFEAWHQRLAAEDAIGSFSDWDMEVRDQIEIGDTIQFEADLRLSPLFTLVTAYLSFAANAQAMGLSRGREMDEFKAGARTMKPWITNKDGGRTVAAYFHPHGVSAPRIIGRLSDPYLVAGLDNIEERYQVVAQVRSILGPSQSESLLRLLRDAPPLPKEVETVADAMKHMAEGAVHLGIIMEDADRIFTYPDVIVQPIAIFK